jgi:DNA replication and repair protein RecF
MRSLEIRTLAVRNVRNLVHVDLDFGERFHVVSGENGQGKTNLLEAIYLLATSRSFRGARSEDLLAYEEDVGSVKGSISEGGATREQSVGIRKGQRIAQVDGKRPSTLAAYAIRTPAVVFHPGEIVLSTGAGAERRRLLDRVALHLAPQASPELERYTRALRERQRALETRGWGASDLAEWEELIVAHGLALMKARRVAAERLAQAAVLAFTRIAAPGLTLGVAYAPGAPEGPGEYREMLESSRAADARRGAAKIGPHRDDLALTLDGHPVRGFASQGQHRTVVLALKSAEIDVVGATRGTRPLLLLDDVSSELDRPRTTALFQFLRQHLGQVFLTTTRRELIDTGEDAGARRDYVASAGEIRPL